MVCALRQLECCPDCRCAVDHLQPEARGRSSGGFSMSEARNRAAIDALVAAINARNLGALDKVFTEDIIMEWPQSGERIRGGSNRREIYSRFPSLPFFNDPATT